MNVNGNHRGGVDGVNMAWRNRGQRECMQARHHALRGVWRAPASRIICASRMAPSRKNKKSVSMAA